MKQYITKATFRDLPALLFGLLGIVFIWLAVYIGGAFTSEVILKNTNWRH